MSAIPTAADAARESDHSFVGHPRGLAYLAFTEAWERFSFYGMQTLLVLYMVRQLLNPGHIESIEDSLRSAPPLSTSTADRYRHSRSRQQSSGFTQDSFI